MKVDSCLRRCFDNGDVGVSDVVDVAFTGNVVIEADDVGNGEAA